MTLVVKTEHKHMEAEERIKLPYLDFQGRSVETLSIKDVTFATRGSFLLGKLVWM